MVASHSFLTSLIEKLEKLITALLGFEITFFHSLAFKSAEQFWQISCEFDFHISVRNMMLLSQNA